MERDAIADRIAEIRHSREVSPKEAALRLYEQKMVGAKQIKKEQRSHERYINHQRYEEFHNKLLMHGRIQKDIIDGQSFIQQQKEMKIMETIHQKKAEARERRKEIKKRDQALKTLERIEEGLLAKLSEQVHIHKEITEELFSIHDPTGPTSSAKIGKRLIKLRAAEEA